MILLGKVISWLVTPVTILLILSVIAWFKRRKPSANRWLGWSITGWILFTNPLIINTVFHIWEGEPEPLSVLNKPYAGVILLTGMLEHTVVFDRPFLSEDGDRVMQTLNLYRSGKVNRIIISGGNVFDSEFPSESEQLKPWFIQQGVPDSCVWIDNKSRNTYQSAFEVWKLLESQPGATNQSYLLVTSAYHMRRSAAMFRKTPLKFKTWPAAFQSLKISFHPTKWFIPSPVALNQWHILFKEWIGLAVYSLKS